MGSRGPACRLTAEQLAEWRARFEAGETQAKYIAFLAGLSRSYVSRLLRGKRGPPASPPPELVKPQPVIPPPPKPPAA